MTKLQGWSESAIPVARALNRKLKSEIAQQTLDIIELDLRAQRIGEAAAQFLENAPRALDINLARHFYRNVVAVIAPAQRPAEWIGLLLGTRGAGAPGLTGT